MQTIGDRIKEKRKEIGLTQLELAEKLNVTDRAVSKWEIGAGDPSISLLSSLAETLNVSIDYLLIGKENESISIDDMDSEKRMRYLIKKDDADNFVKFGYIKTSSYGSRQNSSIYFGSSIRYGQSELKTLNINVWKEILDSNANKIFGKCCDSLLEETKDNISVAVLMTKILDAIIKKCVDLDRDDFLKALGVKYFYIGTNENQRLGQRVTYYIPIVYEQKYDKQKTFAISEETLAYFFEKANESPKAFKYLTELELKAKKNQSQFGRTMEGKECYTCTSLYNEILLNSIKVDNYELISEYFSAFKEEVNKFEMQRDTFYIYSNTFVYSEWSICARFVNFSKEVIDALIKKGKTDLVKEIVAYNKLILDKVINLRSSYGKETGSIYVITEAEIDRLANLNRTDLNEDEKFKLQAVKNHIIDLKVLRNYRDLKLVQEVLNNNYYNYYEFVYDYLTKNKKKELFKFFIDNNYNKLASILIKDDKTYDKLMRNAWTTFNSYPNDLIINIKANDNIGKVSKAEGEILEKIRKSVDAKTIEENKDDPDFICSDTFIRLEGGIDDYASQGSNLLTNNPIIEYIKELKEQIYLDVKNIIASENKIREEEIERKRVAKGLTKEYFEELLKNSDTELFMIKLCALQDAIFMYDCHYEDEDYSARLNHHFKKMTGNAPKSRDIDDGWGYMVLDTEWEENEVKPAQAKISHLRDLFYRLRVSRNNISHPKKETVKELTKDELVECLEYVFSINRKVEA